MANKFIIEIRTRGFKAATDDLDKLKKKTDEYSDKSRKMRLSTASWRAEVGKLRNNLLLISFAFGGLAVAITKATDAYRKQIEATTKLRAGLKNVATASEGGADKLMQLASALQQVTTFSDEEIIAGQAMLATFQLNEDAIGHLSERMLDLAVATGGDVVEKAMQLGKAFTDTATALSRSGTIIDEVGLASARAAGPVAEFAFLGRQLDLNYKGLARSLAETDIGKIDQMTNAIGDLNEELGRVSMPALTVWKRIQKGLAFTASFWAVFLDELNITTASSTEIIDNFGGAWERTFEIMRAITAGAEFPEFGTPETLTTLEKTIKALKEQAAMVRLIGIEEGKKGVTYVESNKNMLDFFAKQNPLLRERLAINVDIQLQEDIIAATRDEGLKATIVQEAKLIELKIKRIQINDAITQQEVQNWSLTTQMFQNAVMSVESFMVAEDNRNKKGEIDAANKIRNERSRQAKLDAIEVKYAARAKQRAKDLKIWKYASAVSNVALGITQTWASPTLTPTMKWIQTVLQATAGAAQLATISASSFAHGGDFVTSGPQPIIVGDNPGGRERVQVTPLSSPNISGPAGGGVNVIFNSPIMSEDYTESTIIPQIKEAVRRGADLGIA